VSEELQQQLAPHLAESAAGSWPFGISADTWSPKWLTTSSGASSRQSSASYHQRLRSVGGSMVCGAAVRALRRTGDQKAPLVCCGRNCYRYLFSRQPATAILSGVRVDRPWCAAAQQRKGRDHQNWRPAATSRNATAICSS
jgi:hypothetical protein